MRSIPSLLFFLLIVTLFSCSKGKSKISATGSFAVKEFRALTNYEPDSAGEIKSIDLDYTETIDSGFFIPTIRQAPSGNFICSFSIKNNSSSAKKYAWKIYYKNDSYCFPEVDSSSGKLNEYAEENFYGSYTDCNITFKISSDIPSDNKYHLINDSITIVGNPRNESRYFLSGRNDRWKRNPRVGIYNFLLVVTEEQELKNIPDYIKNISLQSDGKFISPYYYFQYGDGNRIENLISMNSEDRLRVIARPDLGKGIYIDETSPALYKAKNKNINGCGNDSSLYRTSTFSQYYHYIDKSAVMDNIPVIDDVLKNNYSQIEYNWNRCFYTKEDLIRTTPVVSLNPCETVYSDPVNKKIIIHNPKATFGNWKKENVGIISRSGFTYGKWRIKAKLTELLNKNNMWNGITNAIWLIAQPNDNVWNLRRPCNKEGYLKDYWGSNTERTDRVSYSEIDFEILKTPPYCPDIAFPPVYRNYFGDNKNIDSWNIAMPSEIINEDGNISVACTNWDMACWEPKDFGVGCQPLSHNGKTYEAHRWERAYRAITEKTPAADDKLFGSDYYYFEIEWRPTEIIWRIGPEPDKMYEVGYMNDRITSIPNNQMLLIVTQEFHNTKWWPGSPYQQENIPFPLNDIFGEIYEVVIE